MRKEAVVKKTSIGRNFLIAVFMAALVAASSTQFAFAITAKEIDASVDAALDRFYAQVEGAKEFAKEAKGLLVMPNVKKAGFIVGGEYGTGALRIDGQSVAYYNTISGSVGFQIGAQAKDIIIAFMTDESLKGFQASKGWEAGVDGNVAIITVGGGSSVTTRNVNEPIVGFVFDVKGLMGDISLKGAKFSQIDVTK